MAEPIKSVLLVDYDSLHRSLSGSGKVAAGRLATHASAWVSAIASGALIRSGGRERDIGMKRCYADPTALGEDRDRFAAAGFEIVPCPPGTGGVHTADMNITVDAMECLADAYDEFIVLSAEPGVAPLLTRLRQNGRKTAIYADATTTPAHRALADAVLDSAAFAEFLLARDTAEASTVSPERNEIEAFARKIHAATNIPLFSPKTFAELFGYLTEEIATNGYHFQTTAKNVANRLIESGRSVTRRQVVFVVKGLALRGHVFSTNDTPRDLAEAFLAQASYLVDNADLTLDDHQQQLLRAWLVDRVTTGAPPPVALRAKPPAEPPKPAATASKPPAIEEPVAASATPPARGPAAPPDSARPAARDRAASQATRPSVRAPATKPAQRPGEPSRDDVRSGIAARVAAAMRTKPAQPPPGTPSRDDTRSGIAARVAAAMRTKPPSRAATPAEPPPRKAPPAGGPSKGAGAAAGDPIENSILAAIAEAVDVLVESSADRTGREAPTPAKMRPAQPPPEAKPKPKPRSEARSKPTAQEKEEEDIGDEIQRIIASYNRERRDPPGE